MKRFCLALLAFGMALVFDPRTLLAKDYCITFPGVPGFAIVGKAFAIPVKNTCKTWAGFYVSGGAESATSGAGCTSADGSHLLLTLTTTFPQVGGGSTTVDSIVLSLPSQTGNDNETQISDQGTYTNAAEVAGGKCSVVIPVPTEVSGPLSGAPTVNGVGGAEK